MALTAKARPPANWKVVGSGQVSTMVPLGGLGPSSSSLRDDNLRTVGGKLSWSGTAKEPHWSVIALGIATGPDFHMTLEVRQVSGTAGTFYGLVFHKSNSPSNYYIMEANDARLFRVARAVERSAPNLFSLSSSSCSYLAIFCPQTNAGSVNRLAVRGEGSHYVFFINDLLVGNDKGPAEVVDTDLTGGEAGILVAADNAGDSFNFEFGNVEVRAP